jgi:uncharacterized membrane protein YphA (DoxX/SURF4 family)
MKTQLSYDASDLIFRLLFSLIFLGLGLEHIFSDELIQGMMPVWIGSKRIASLVAGVVLVGGGLSVAIGYNVRPAAMMLGGFLIVVTLTIHLPALFHQPAGLPADWSWLWDVYQRSNFFKNLCLLGVCFHLTHHRVGKFAVGRAGTSAPSRAGRESEE